MGDDAVTLLRPDPPRLVIEVDAVQGETPTSSALAHLRSVLSQVVSKPGGIDVIATASAGAAQRAKYTVEDLVALEGKYRRTRRDATQASVYVLYLNGSYAGSDSALAVSYGGSSFAVFSEQLDAAVTALVSRAPIERAVLVHEAGHLMRLVNVGYRSPRNHEDKAHPNHSSNPDSVMYWAVEDISVTALLKGGPPDDFDAADRADLDDIKAGRL